MYTPDQKILAKYADLLIKFALNGGKGARKGEVVQINIPDVAKPLYKELLRATLQSGAYPKTYLIPTETDKTFFEYASDDQLIFFPEAFKRAEADLVDRRMRIQKNVLSVSVGIRYVLDGQILFLPFQAFSAF
jgi:leucyl aminopeptidase (aminopeptidase T)